MQGKTLSFSTMLLCALASAALFWVIEYHWQHALGLLPYLLFLSCPLMHLFMHHGGHGGHGGHDNHGSGDGGKP